MYPCLQIPAHVRCEPVAAALVAGGWIFHKVAVPTPWCRDGVIIGMYSSSGVGSFLDCHRGLFRFVVHKL